MALLFDGDQGPRPLHWPVIKAEDVDGEMTCGLDEGFCPVGVRREEEEEKPWLGHAGDGGDGVRPRPGAQRPTYFFSAWKYGFAPEAWSVMSFKPSMPGMLRLRVVSMPCRSVTSAIPQP